MFKRPNATQIARSRELRRDATEIEKRLWWKLRELNARGYHFRRQVPFRGYVLDFAEHRRRLVIELDGGQHGEPEHRTHDARRDSVLTFHGCCTLRFWNTDVIENIDGVIETIIRESKRHRPPPEARCALRPPHKGEVGS